MQGIVIFRSSTIIYLYLYYAVTVKRDGCLPVLKGVEIMRISLIQFSVVPGDRDANFEQARRHVQTAASDGADVAVLSELWDTSFYPSDIREKADEEGALARAFLQDLAKEYHIHLVGVPLPAVMKMAFIIRPISLTVTAPSFHRTISAICLRLAKRIRLYGRKGSQCVFPRWGNHGLDYLL